MKKSVVLFSIIHLCALWAQPMQVRAKKFAAIPLLLGYVAKDKKETVQELADYIKRDFSFTNQFEVSIKEFDTVPTKKEIQAFKSKKEPYLFALFVTPSGNNFEWCLFNMLESKQIACKKYKKKGNCVRGWAHNIADMAWAPLTSQEGFFSTRITYAKNATSGTARHVKHIYIADYDGSHEEPLIHTPTINVSPRWNGDLKNPLIFYSEFTKTNMRLMVSDLNGKKSVASDFDGLNMIPSFSKDGKKVVYCMSRGDGQCQLYMYQKGNFRKLTSNNGNNISPSLSDDGKTVYFSSDYQGGNPQIYAYYIDKDELEQITTQGYCVSPRYFQQTHKLAYGKWIDGFLQLCVYDLKNKTHEQVTFGPGNKEGYAWAPCGTKLMYSQELNGKGQIVMINLFDLQTYSVTARGANCTYPDWSPVYKQFPVMVA